MTHRRTILYEGVRPHKRMYRAFAFLITMQLFLSFSCQQAVNAQSSPRLSLEFKDTDIRDILKALSAIANVNIVADSTVEGKISLKIRDLDLPQALDAVLGVGGYKRTLRNGVYLVSHNALPEIPSVNRDSSGNLTIEAKDADLRQLLLTVSKEGGISVVPAPSLAGTISIELQQISAKDVVPILAKAGGAQCSQQNGVWFVDPTPTKVDYTRPDTPKRDTVLTRMISMKYLKATDAVDYMSKCASGSSDLLRQSAAIRCTKEDHALLVTGTEDAIAEVKDELAQIDVPAPQVMLEAKLLELNGSSTKDLGLVVASGNIGGNLSVDLLKGELSYSSAGYKKSINATIQALVERGKGKIIASPSICTVTGHEASIDIGDVEYFKVTNTDSQSSGTAVYYPYTTLQTVNSGISLKITPWVGANGDITATIQPEVSSVTGITADGLPQISRRKANTIIRVKDGDTIVIGGLTQHSKNSSVQSTPILGDIPILGNFFRTTKVTSSETELLIFITPKILSIDGQSKEKAEIEKK